jgi:hypothetical protein
VKTADELDPKRNDESSVTSSRDSFQLLYSGKNKKYLNIIYINTTVLFKT